VDHQTDMTQVDSCSDLIARAALEGFEAGSCYHAVSLETLHTIDITSYMVGQGYRMDPVDYDWWMGRVRALATSAMQPLLDTFASLPVKETDGQLMRFSSDMPHRNGSGLQQLERMVQWMRQRGFLPAPQHPAGTLPLPIPTKPKPALVAPESHAPAPVVAAPAVPKMQPIRVADSQAPAAVSAAAAAPAAAVPMGAPNAGIHAMELYTPNHCVDQTAMEQHHNCPGKYTAGLLQEQIGFCGDDEDSVSMALTVVSRLLKRANIPLDKIGRVEVGTESLLDRSKSIKTHLMTIFQAAGCYDIEGVDNYNACYGGTAAFLNTMAWLQSPAWDGRYGLVVCVDIADFADHQAFLNGASAVALLLGPDAPVVLERERATCMINSWDFYKPVGWKDAYPMMPDGKHSIDCYMACLDMCYRKLSEKVYQGQPGNLVEDHDYFVHHCTSTYLCKRAFKRVCENAYPKSDEIVEGIFGTVGPAGGMAIKLKEQQTLYENKAEPATLITKRVGSSYTASCYTNLYSLFATVGEALLGKRIVVYSYGSGSASTMYRLTVRGMPTFDRDVFATLDARVKHEPKSYLDMITAYTASTYGRYDFKPSDWGGKQPGAWYLTAVDELGKRFYEEYAAA
jgi:hydroxymethylglutaryl-CoA synthase